MNRYAGTMLIALVLGAPSKAEISSTLPPVYSPPAQTGIIRIWGHPELEDVVDRWRDAFTASHADTRVELNLTGSDIAMAALYTGQADVVLLGRDATPSEIQAFEWVYQYKPSSIEILRGSVDTPARSAALSVLVHESNPLDVLTLSQVQAAFSFAPKLTDKSVKTWGQLGLDGIWRDAPVRLYTFDTETGTGRYFRKVALGDTRHLDWERLREFKAEASGCDPASTIANRQVLAALRRDRYGLGVAVADDTAPGIKALALRTCDDCQPVSLSPESVADRSYPLSREVNAYFNRPNDGEIDPVLSEFLEFVIGPGQSLVEADDGYLALRKGLATIREQ